MPQHQPRQIRADELTRDEAQVMYGLQLQATQIDNDSLFAMRQRRAQLFRAVTL